MVRALHAAGLEVILDVVYNHTGEGNHLGPTLSFRGIDNAAYYRLNDDDPRFYFDVTGTGNSLNVRNPHTLQLIMDSLRYWVIEMHVDGFRFDLASALARQFYDVDRLSAFFDIIHQDPVLSRVKLVAEPWDVGAGGYQVGNFPVRWAEWNGAFRDTVRDFWRGATGIRDLAYRLTGSSDLYQGDGRQPSASINFVTAHDGFTLRRSGRRTTRSTTRPTARTTGTAPTTTARGTAASKATPTTPRSSSCARASGAISSPPCCSPRDARCCSAATRSGGRSTATTTRTARTTRLSWIDWEHVDEPMLAFVAADGRAAPKRPGAAPAELLLGPGGARIGAQGHRLVPAFGSRGQRRGVVRRRPAIARDDPQRR